MNTRSLLVPLALVAGSIFGTACYAAGPTGSTGECKDGSYTSTPTKRGACAGHCGVKDWYAEEKAALTPSKAPQGQAAAPATAPARPTASAGASAAPGGGAGKVWVNTPTKVYHCNNDRGYGKTREGEYMSESEAKAKGYRADHGHACS